MFKPIYSVLFIMLIALCACDRPKDIQANVLFTECAEVLGSDLGPQYATAKCRQIAQAVNNPWGQP